MREEVRNEVQVTLIQLAAEVAVANLLCVIAITKLERPTLCGKFQDQDMQNEQAPAPVEVSTFREYNL